MLNGVGESSRSGTIAPEPTIIDQTRIIGAVRTDNQGASQGAEIDQMLPIALIAGLP
jgi:hypothetical protein